MTIRFENHRPIIQEVLTARNIQLALAIASVMNCVPNADAAAGFRPLPLIAGFCNLGLGMLANVSLAIFLALALGIVFAFSLPWLLYTWD